MNKWTSEQDRAGKLQGWLIAYTDGGSHPPYELESLDDDSDGGACLLANDRAAHEFVKDQADKGDTLALAALEYLKDVSPEEYNTIINAKHEGWD